MRPGGRSASSSTAINSSVEAEACSEGLTTTALPAASAGASFQMRTPSGEFQAVISAQTPKGSQRR